MKNEALLIVDAQKDFGEKGRPLYVKQGEQIVQKINQLIEETKARAGIVIASRDWHPENHSSFKIWPKHCVQNTSGAEYLEGLNTDGIDYEVLKGFEEDKDSYSAFGGFEFIEGIPVRSLMQILEENKIEVLRIVGLATDYCVKATAIDGVKKFEVEVIKEGIRAVNVEEGDGDKAIEEMIKEKVKVL